MTVVQDTPTIIPGRYRHYKGNLYDVIGVGEDTETEETVVIYRPLYKSDVDYWVRPLVMFCDTVIVEGLSVPRFTRIDNDLSK